MIKLKDADKVNKALKDAQRGARVRILDIKQLDNFTRNFKTGLNLTNKDMHGLVLDFAPEAADPKRYGGGPGRRSKMTYYPATCARLVFKGNDWYIDSITRDDTYTSADRLKIVEAPPAVEAALQRKISSLDFSLTEETKHNFTYEYNVKLRIPAALENEFAAYLSGLEYTRTEDLSWHMAPHGYVETTFSIDKMPTKMYYRLYHAAYNLSRGYRAGLDAANK
jgi:hypothetical protein